jgi:hypothetical protein
MSDDTEAFFLSEGAQLEPSELLKKSKHGWMNKTGKKSEHCSDHVLKPEEFCYLAFVSVLLVCRCNDSA